jgi:hypothetical protein
MSENRDLGEEQKPDYFSKADQDLFNSLENAQADTGDVPSRIAPWRRVEWGTVGGWLLFLAVAGGVAWYFIHQHRAHVKEQHVAEIQQQKIDASIAALTLRYKAVTNWAAALPDRGFGEHFSIDVSRALIRSASGKDDPLRIETRPVLVKCHLKDIAEKDAKIIASFSSLDADAPDLSLELQCNPEQLKSFTGTNELSQFAVIARCHDVQRLGGDVEGFSVKGELLEVISLLQTRNRSPSGQSGDADEPDAPQLP